MRTLNTFHHDARAMQTFWTTHRAPASTRWWLRSSSTAVSPAAS